jgi:CubicO group peptidase (beta-lactamase class C family)
VLNIYELEQRINGEMQRHNVPSFAIALVQGDEITYARGFGVTSVEPEMGVPVTPQTLFCSGSISKTLTATAIMRLVEQGKVELDQPVTKYLPWLTFSQPEYSEGVTLRRILSHKSGLYGSGGAAGPVYPDALRDFVRDVIPTSPFVAPPGKAFTYCNSAIDIAGHVAEAVTGKYFPELMRELVFAPLEMERTTYDRNVAMTYPVALPHITDENGQVRVQHLILAHTSGNPAGYVMSSTHDLANFVVMQLNEGRFKGRQILQPASVAEMQSLQYHSPKLIRRLVYEYGLALWISTYKGVTKWVGHAGMLTPYLCQMVFLPEKGVGVVVQSGITNDFEQDAIINGIFDSLIGAPAQYSVPPLPVVEPDKTTWYKLTGDYLSYGEGLVTIAQSDDALTLDRDGQITPFVALSKTNYTNEAQNTEVVFLPQADESRPVEHLVMGGEVYHRVELDPNFAPDLAELENRLGLYRFADDDTAVFRMENGQLYVRFNWLPDEVLCRPVSDNLFSTRYGVCSFGYTSQGVRQLFYQATVIAVMEQPAR